MADTGFTVISTIATSGSGVASEVYAEVYAFHQMLAKKYSGLSAIQADPVTVKRVRVIVSSASLRQAADIASPRLVYAVMGDLLTQIGSVPNWIQTDHGWILAKQVEAI